MEVGGLMATCVYRVAPESPISDVARIMRANDIGAVPVEERGRLVGIVTDRDIVTRILGKGGRASAACAREAMTPSVFCAFDHEDAESVARRMRDLQIRRMPVLDENGDLVGIVSLGDLACRVRPEIVGDALEGISESLGG